MFLGRSSSVVGRRPSKGSTRLASCGNDFRSTSDTAAFATTRQDCCVRPRGGADNNEALLFQGQLMSNFSSTTNSLRTNRNTANSARRNAPVERKERVPRRAQPAIRVACRQPFPSNQRRADLCFVERAFRKWRDRSLWIW